MQSKIWCCLNVKKQSSNEHERFLTQNSPIYFEIFLENIDYIHPSENRTVDDAQKRASITMHPAENLKNAENLKKRP